MTRRVLAITLAIGALAGLTGLLAFVGTTLMPHSTSSVAVVKRAGPEFAEPGAVPIGRSFELIDHSGRSVDASTYLGKFLLVFFGFANCPDVCPTTLGDIAQAMELLGPDAGKIQPLFISLDPERDSMAILAEYVRAFHPAIVGLTGTAAQIKAAAASYQVFYEKVPPTEPVRLKWQRRYEGRKRRSTFQSGSRNEALVSVHRVCFCDEHIFCRCAATAGCGN